MSNLNINRQGGRAIHEEGENRNKDCNMKKSIKYFGTQVV